MQKKGPQFNVQELFDSLPPQEQNRINCSIVENARNREEARYARLQMAEIAKNELVQELDRIKFEIAKNDNWFIWAKEHRFSVGPYDINLHRNAAGELYSRKKTMIDRLLPEAESNIKDVISQIETEEAQEPFFQTRDLGGLLLPFYEERERERRQTIVADVKERIRQREEEEEAKRQKRYAAFIERLRREELDKSRLLAEELEKSRLLAEKQQKIRAEKICARVHARQIPYLVHFTPISNVESILKNGLRSRNALNGHDYKFTDKYRTDGLLDWISFSVSFPNYKMFYAKKNLLNDIDGWAIVLIKKEVLWELDCKFILTNAASFGIRMFLDESRSSVDAFEDMFSYAEHRIGIPEFYTTDPQAEVMIRDEVPSHYIDVIAVERQADAQQLGNLKIGVEIIPKLFKWRDDFEHWRQFRLSTFPAESRLVVPY